MSNPREPAFVPLTPAKPGAAPRGDLSVTIVPQAQNVIAFSPLGERKSGAATAENGQACEPRITLQRDGDRVSAIHVQCSCGQVIELACVYDSKASPG